MSEDFRKVETTFVISQEIIDYLPIAAQAHGVDLEGDVDSMCGILSSAMYRIAIRHHVDPVPIFEKCLRSAEGTRALQESINKLREIFDTRYNPNEGDDDEDEE